MPRRAGRIRTAALATLAAILAASAGAWALIGGEQAQPRIGLLTTLPIYWGEAFDVAEAIDAPGNPHWVRTLLEEHYRLVPLDTLDGGSPALGGFDYLLLAQPRAFSPGENVALDAWVRAGGRVLIFADPMLTGPTRFHIGDRRRPQDVVLLSPILRRWGLELQFDPDQPEGERAVPVWGATMPVSQAGTFIKPPVTDPSTCAIEAEGLVADCRVGSGRVVVVADAAILQQGDEQAAASRTALETILERAFGR